MFKEVLKIPKIRNAFYDKAIDLMANLLVADEKCAEELIDCLESCESPEELNDFIEGFASGIMSVDFNDELIQETIDDLQNYLDNSGNEELQ